LGLEHPQVLWRADPLARWGLQAVELGPQNVGPFDPLGVDWDASHRAHLNALGFVKMTHAFRAFVRIDLVDLAAHVNGLVGALGFAHIAIDALIGDHQSHVSSQGDVWPTAQLRKTCAA
jgi:hypothetical protein